MIHSVAKAPAQTPLWSWLLQWGSVLVLLVVAWIPFNEPMPLPLRLLFTLIAVFSAVVFLVAPRRLRYSLNEGLQISCVSSMTTWPYAGLRVRLASGHLGLMMGGTGMAGYYTGNFQWRGEGPKHVQALASRMDEGVLLEVRGHSQMYFLTPADPAGFLQRLRERGANVTD
jgi:hypothetical protein